MEKGGGKITADSVDGKALRSFHLAGKATGWTPKRFFESEQGTYWRKNYDFATFQNAWNNTKNRVAKSLSNNPGLASAASGGKSTSTSAFPSTAAKPKKDSSWTKILTAIANAAPNQSTDACPQFVSPAALAASKRAAGESLGPDDAKRPRSTSPHPDNVSVSYDTNASADTEHFDFTSISSEWHPIASIWPWTDGEGREMVAIEFVFPAGSSPGNTEGVNLHAFGSILSITIDWPQRFMDEDTVYKYYTPEELADKNTKRMLDAKMEHIRKLKQFAEICKKATVIIQLPFEVIETRRPQVKPLFIKSTNTRTLTIRLANVKEPTFQKPEVKQDAEYDD